MSPKYENNCENVHGNKYMVPYRNHHVRISALSTAIEATRKHWMRERSRCVHVSEGDEMPILTFETRLRFCFLQSHSSRREREFFHLISGFETRSRVLFASSRPRDKIENFCHLISKFETRSRFFNEKGQWCYHWYKVIPSRRFCRRLDHSDGSLLVDCSTQPIYIWVFYVE